MSEQEDPSNDDSQHAAELVETVLASLPDRFQAVLSLHYLADMSVAEIAQVLNARPGTVKSRLARGRKLMKKRLSRNEY